ncbi:DNA primase [Litorihabitans aurantiacus]|uniref:DNA primase n=1 Tax=Litorihabitans aurantiacus TaxID=1930061 RepID=A0AA37UQ24_9MICO|nr:DNA primase [Litorihabitans aurantiacus]GMA31001.1 DNA primase [Litorihabitans aurantiacus]
MALLHRDSIAAVRETAKIEEVVGEHVALKSAGVGSMKGLCPFHDERTPSFHVRPPVQLWHCFGCGEGGDVISFVQKIDHLPFAEAVERLAGRYNVTLRYEEDATGAPSRPREEPGKRQRLVEAHRVAAEFFAQQLTSPEAGAARAFLAERGFDRAAAAHFGVGYAPKGWDSLLRHLQGRAFTQAELSAAGLVSQGNRGHYDRFRGRLMWPIRDLTGDVIGFGARRLYDDDPGPKYLNTPETPIYHKAQVLYGIDLAKKAISQGRQVVVVEGYTDVMACHLAGITTAVATCGTSFGTDHTRIIRRLLGDSQTGATGVLLSSGRAVGGEVIFTFDGDAAGQKAAMRAFDEDQQFAAQTFVSVSSDGLDPCEVRVQQGDGAVRKLISDREPLFEFAIRTALSDVDMATAEGRVAGLRVAAPVVATIRDVALRAEYARQLAGWVQMEPADVRRAVTDASRRRPPSRPGDSGGQQRGGPGGGRDGRDPRQGGGAEAPVPRAPVLTDPVARLERQVLEVALQFPAFAAPAGFDALDAQTFQVPSHRAVHDALRAAGGVAAPARTTVELGGTADAHRAASARWVTEVLEGATATLAPLVREMTVAPIPAVAGEMEGYTLGVVTALRRLGLTRRIGDLKSHALALDPGDPDSGAAWAQVYALEDERRRLSDT